ncbi:MAG: peptidase [Salinivenus sp.]
MLSEQLLSRKVTATGDNRNRTDDLSLTLRKPPPPARPFTAGKASLISVKRLLFVFLDGIGIGAPGRQNPLDTAAHDAFSHVAGGQPWVDPFSEHSTSQHCVRGLDATLEVDGLPQSGTGQGTLLTGHNCAALVGRHFGPYPHSNTHEVLDRAGLFRKVKALGLPPPTFANAFPPQYFDADRRRWESVTTRCVRAAGLGLRDIHALRADRALAADLTGASWRTQLHLSVPRRDEADAARVLAELARQHSLTFFEYFRTDKVGHRRIDTPPHALLAQLNRFLHALLDSLPPSEDTLLITSDHGNLEEAAHTQHTRNPVPLIVRGWAAPYFADATSLADVTPAIVQALRTENRKARPQREDDREASG